MVFYYNGFKWWYFVFQPVEDWESGNVTASVGESGQCLCHVYLPDTTFPADRVEHMQQVSKDLILEVKIQMDKVLIKVYTDSQHYYIIFLCDFGSAHSRFFFIRW